MTDDYNKRFEVLRSNIFKPMPYPSYIINIMQGLHLSQKLARQLAYRLPRTTIRQYLRKELENIPSRDEINEYEHPHIVFMPDNTWRYFKLNCCAFADRYDEPPIYTNENIKSSLKPLLHIKLDLIRLLNNWFSAKNAIFDDSSCKGLFINIADVDDDTGMDYLLKKADELAIIYGFDNAEQFFEAKLLHPEITQTNLNEALMMP